MLGYQLLVERRLWFFISGLFALDANSPLLSVTTANILPRTLSEISSWATSSVEAQTLGNIILDPSRGFDKPASSSHGLSLPLWGHTGLGAWK